MSSLWYCCKYCRQSFQEGKDLISHKKLKHPAEYRVDKKRRKREKRRENYDNPDHDKVHESDTDTLLSSRSSIGTELKSVLPTKEATVQNQPSNSRDGRASQSSSLGRVPEEGKKSRHKFDTKSNTSSNNEKSSKLKLSSSISPVENNEQNESTQKEDDPASGANDISSEGRECIYCGRVFQKLVMMVKHVRIIHRTTRAFECDFCSKKFNTVSNRNYHVRNHCDVLNNKLNSTTTKTQRSPQKNNKRRLKDNQCGICLQVLKKASYLKDHVAGMHRGEARFQCLVCDARFIWATQLSRHKKKCHDTTKKDSGEGRVQSSSSKPRNNQEDDDEIAERASWSSSSEHQDEKVPNDDETNDDYDDSDGAGGDRKKISGRQNKNTKTAFKDIPKFISPQKFEGKRVFVCDFCFKIIPHLYLARSHVLTHTGERPFKCSFCPKTFVYQRTMQDHERVHLGHRPYKCSYCSKRFHSSTAKSHHQLQYHVPGRLKTGRRNDMTIGQARRRRQLSPLKRKKTTKSPSRPNIKSVSSSLQYSPSSVYVTQKKSRSGSVTHICNFCNKEFPFLSRALRHIPSHTGQKDFKCSFCDQLFSYDAHRKSHERSVHSHENRIKKRPTLVQKKRRIRSLDVVTASPHVKCRVIDGKKMYTCQFCKKNSYRLDHIVDHTRIHTGEKPFQCLYCEMTFAWRSSKNSHERTCH